MNNRNAPKFKRNETFSIREGWLEKAINKVKENNRCFLNNEGTTTFGIGSNMVKALKFWINVSQICTFSNQKGASLTDFGEVLLEKDRYLENPISWWLIHYNLVMNEIENPVFYQTFHSSQQAFQKDSYTNYLYDYYISSYENINKSSIENDVLVLFKTYVKTYIDDPENNMNSPLSRLGLMNEKNKQFVKEHPLYDSLNSNVILFVLSRYSEALAKETNLQENYQKEFNLDDFLNSKYSPIYIFNLTRSSIFSYLDELRNKKMINLVRTAGLNTLILVNPINVNEVYD